MACHGITYNGRCFPIYEVMVQWPPKGPEPDPLRHLFDDVAILVTLNNAVSRLSDRRLRETLSEGVRGAARSLSLPDGMTLGDGLFKHEKALELAE